jgi:hypothetical protein
MSYLIQVRRDTATNWSLKNPILVAGEIAFETDTKKVKIGDGTTAWNSLADIGNFISTALLAAGGTFTGNVFGPTLPQSHNYIINGAFDFWQRGTSFTANNSYTADRWYFAPYGTAVSATISRLDSDLPSEFRYGLRMIAPTTSNANFNLLTPLETSTVIPLRGSSVTLSFYYRIPTNFTGTLSPLILWSTGTDARLDPGTGTGISATSLANTTSWTRYTHTFVLPSTASSLAIGLQTYNNTVQNAEIQITGVQLEAGSVATPFKRNAPSIQAELAACHRYYYQIGVNGINFNYQADPNGFGASNFINFPTIMRIAPTVSLNFTNTDNAVNSGPLSISPLGFISRANRSNGSFSYFAYQIGFTASAEL